MTEYETASLALREAALYTAIAHVAVSLFIGLGQIGVVLHGIRAMQKMGAQRAAEAAAREKAEMRRHTESMATLNQIIRQHDETEQRRHEAEMLRHAESMAALNELIRRTAAPGTA